MNMPKQILYPDDLKLFILSSKPDAEGWVPTSQIVAKIRKSKDCSIPTAYKLLWEQVEILDFKHGKIRLNLPELPELPQTEFLNWLKERNSSLDKIVQFLNTQPPSAKKSDMLVRIGVVREDLKDGLEYGLEELYVRLEQQFGKNKEELSEESKVLRVSKKERAEDTRQVPAEKTDKTKVKKEKEKV